MLTDFFFSSPTWQKKERISVQFLPFVPSVSAGALARGCRLWCGEPGVCCATAALAKTPGGVAGAGSKGGEGVSK